ncbi:MAG TPA: response regulator [Blastocatellia bacterium]|jgi:DNA-binding response OmpR family regulator|nr:response regulator [Blastocatellia bacterium]
MNSIKPHILIVEDDEDTRFVYSVLLQMEGYCVTHVGTIADAMSRVLSTGYDLIIMDVRLPDGDGIELCRKIRAFNRVTPIMFVSAAAYQKDVERGMKAGAQAYLTKPADAENLLDRVKYLLGQKAMIPLDRDLSRLTGLIADASVAAALIDKDRKYKAVSTLYAEAGGYSASELIGKTVTDIFPDVSGEAGQVLEAVQQSKQPYFIPRYPYTHPHNPERGITYWDAAMWPIESSESDTDVLIVVREKEKSGDIVMA